MSTDDIRVPSEVHDQVSRVQVNVDDVIAAWKDPEVQQVLRSARMSVRASRAAGRRVEL
jgi:hypothetical protein